MIAEWSLLFLELAIIFSRAYFNDLTVLSDLLYKTFEIRYMFLRFFTVLMASAFNISSTSGPFAYDSVESLYVFDWIHDDLLETK